MPVIRADFETRKADTLAWVKVPRTDITMSQTDDGGMRMIARINPLPQGDDWALMSDGTLAVVRVLDYHVDYFAPDGSHTSSPKLPFDWKRITDEEKTKLIDSLKVTAKEASDRAAAQQAQGGGRGFRASFEPVSADKLPDYVPPIRPGTTLADHDGNIWILPATSSIAAQLAQQAAGFGGGGRGGMPGMGGAGGPPGAGAGIGARQPATAGAGRTAAGAAGAAGATRPDSAAGGRGGAGFAGFTPPTFQFVYDVVNGRGELVERIKLPPNRTIVGFGPGGVVFLSAREGRNVFIEKVRRVVSN